MNGSRDNDQWLRDLRATGAQQSSALEDLRGYLLRALPGSLKSHGSIPQDLVEDAVQEALVRALDHLDRFEGRSRLTTWVTTIAVRAALTELRRLRWKDVSLEEVMAGGELTLEGDDPTEGPESNTARSEISRVLGRILETELSERQRVTIVAELNGMPQEEVGRRLGTTRNAVYKLGHDARKKLKRGLEQAGFDAAEIRAAFS